MGTTQDTRRRTAEIRLPDGDGIAIRIVVSPYFTLLASIVEVLHELSRGSPPGWHQYVRERCAGLDVAAFDVLGAHVPDFLTQVVSPHAGIEDELRAIRDTPAERVRRELRHEFGDAIPPPYRPFMLEPERALERLVSALEEYWAAVLAPKWPAMESLLEREVLRAGAALATEGPSALLARVSHRLELRGDVLGWSIWPDGEGRTPGAEPDLRDRRLILIPMCCGPDALLTSLSRDDSVLLGYSAPGVGLLWEQPGEHADEALDQLSGRTRADVLRAVHSTASTADVAAELGVSPALANHHLKALRELGLVHGNRFGRFVYYRMTTRGRRLWEAIGPDPSLIDAARGSG